MALNYGVRYDDKLARWLRDDPSGTTENLPVGAGSVLPAGIVLPVGRVRLFGMTSWGHTGPHAIRCPKFPSLTPSSRVFHPRFSKMPRRKPMKSSTAANLTKKAHELEWGNRPQSHLEGIAHLLGSGAYSVEDFGKDLKALVPKGIFKKLGAVLGQGAGAAIGTLVGHPEAGYQLGKRLGSKLGAATAKITGMGSYKVHANTLGLQGGQVDEGQQVPSFENAGRSNRIQRVEFVSDILGNDGTFNSTVAQALNPANTTLFPWLSRIAPNYQKYRFHGLVFMFKSMSSEYASGVALGTIVMATNYNINDSPFADKATMEQAEYTVSCKPSVSILHPIECDPSTYSGPLFVRGGADPATVEDNRLYDMGLFQLAQAGIPAAANNAVLGELWVSYDIELLEPYISPADTAPGFSLLWAPTDVSEDTPFGDLEMAWNPENDDYGPTLLGKEIKFRPSEPNTVLVGNQGSAVVIMTTECSLPAGGLAKLADAPVLSASVIDRLPVGGGLSPSFVLLNGYSVYLDGSVYRYEVMTAMFYKTGVNYHPIDPPPIYPGNTGEFTVVVALPPEVEAGGGAFQSNSLVVFNADDRMATFISAQLSWRKRGPMWRDLPYRSHTHPVRLAPECVARATLLPVTEQSLPTPPANPPPAAAGPPLSPADFTVLRKK